MRFFRTPFTRPDLTQIRREASSVNNLAPAKQIAGRRKIAPLCGCERDAGARVHLVLHGPAPRSATTIQARVLTIHRDFGDRTDRKHARLKYVVAERGVDFMQDEVN